MHHTAVVIVTAARSSLVTVMPPLIIVRTTLVAWSISNFAWRHLSGISGSVVLWWLLMLLLVVVTLSLPLSVPLSLSLFDPLVVCLDNSTRLPQVGHTLQRVRQFHDAGHGGTSVSGPPGATSVLQVFFQDNCQPMQDLLPH